MTARSSAASLVLLLAPLLLPSASTCVLAGHDLFCPKTVFYKPKPPRIHYKCICPQRICPCCPLPNFGYYPTRWQPWPFPSDCSHGPALPAATNAQDTQRVAPTSSEPLSQPSKLPQEPTLP